MNVKVISEYLIINDYLLFSNKLIKARLLRADVQVEIYCHQCCQSVRWLMMSGDTLWAFGFENVQAHVHEVCANILAH